MTELHHRMISGVGLLAMIFFAWLISYDRKRFPTRVVISGTLLQLVFGIFVLKTRPGLWFFSKANDAIAQLLNFTDHGSRFLFGVYAEREFTFALRVLPTIIFFSSLMAVLYQLGLMQRVVQAMAWLMQRTLQTSGPETLAAAANIFVGQTEAPLVVKPYVAKMTQSELMAIMVGGFAGVAGGVLAAYVGMLRQYFPDIAGHLIATSVMSAPASLLIAKVVLPEKEVVQAEAHLSGESPYANVVDAAASGAAEGLQLALNVGAMLLAFTALVALVNYLFAWPALAHNQGVLAELRHHVDWSQLPGCAQHDTARGSFDCVQAINHAGTLGYHAPWAPWTLERILGFVLWPLAFIMGVPTADCTAVASLLGEKTILNEFVAYVSLADNLRSTQAMSPRAALIATYALCGFANISSIAIQIGGIGAMAPERRADLAKLGFRAMIAGSFATFMTACIAGMLA